MIKNIIIFLVIFITILIFKNSVIINTNIIFASELFIKKIFPSLFPMFLLSSILINLNIIKYFDFFFIKITNFIFKINNNLSYILIMSLISGFPSSAKIAKEMYDKNIISKKNIQKILLFTHFANPLFIFAMIDKNAKLILFAHFLSNFIIGICTRNFLVDNSEKKIKLSNHDNLISSIFNSINNSISTLLFIFGTITTFYIISSVINLPIFKILLELSQGLNYIIFLNINDLYKTILCGGLISFGGICIHFQVYGILSELKIKYWPYLIARLTQSIVTMFIIFLLY